MTHVERYIMLPRSRSLTLHTYISATPILGVRNDMLFIPKSIPTLGVEPKRFIGRINAPNL
jgi:hypothetical protein